MPLIVLSDTVDADAAVTAMRAGAVDYVAKDRLERLGAAVERALEVSRARQEAPGAEERSTLSKRETDLLFRAALALGSSPDLATYLGGVVDTALQLLPIRCAYVAVNDVAAGSAEILAAGGSGAPALAARVPLGDLLPKGDEGSWLCAPIVDVSGPSGALCVQSDRAEGFGGEDDRKLAMLAAMAGGALREARLRRVAEVSVARHAAVLRAARRVAEGRDAEQALRDLLQEALVLLSIDNGTVYRWDEPSQLLIGVATTIKTSPDDPRLNLRPGQGVAGQAIETRRPVRIDRYQSLSYANPVVQSQGIQSALGVPLLHEGRLLGALVVGSSDPSHHFQEEDEAVLELLASLASAVLIGLERAHLWAIQVSSRELAHRLNNHLAVAVGTIELLQTAGGVPARLTGMVDQSARSLQLATEDIRQFQQLSRFETHETPVGQALDLDRSRQTSGSGLATSGSRRFCHPERSEGSRVAVRVGRSFACGLRMTGACGTTYTGRDDTKASG